MTIIWIAQNFTDEHRATLDWLNEITDERFNFFGLEIELWRIGESPVAPKFNVISQPNDWSKTITRAASGMESSELTETQRIQFAYWTEFHKLLRESGSKIKGTKARHQHWNAFAVGRSEFSLDTVVNLRDKSIRVDLVLSGPNAKPHFDILQRDKAAIESEIGFPLSWYASEGKKQCRLIVKREDVDATNESDWPRQHEWLREKLNSLARSWDVFVKGGAPGT